MKSLWKTSRQLMTTTPSSISNWNPCCFQPRCHIQQWIHLSATIAAIVDSVVSHNRACFSRPWNSNRPAGYSNGCKRKQKVEIDRSIHPGHSDRSRSEADQRDTSRQSCERRIFDHALGWIEETARVTWWYSQDIRECRLFLHGGGTLLLSFRVRY